MDCKIPGRQTRPVDTDGPALYGLDGMTTGQALYAHSRANQFLNRVMMDPAAPSAMKGLIRQQNAIGVLMLQDLLAAFAHGEARDN
jgi:hypothetical protein